MNFDQDRGIAVVIAAYEAEAFLAEALQSVLRQQRAVAEIVVVDDGSGDGTARVAEQFAPEVRLIKREREGAGAARAAGLAATSAPLVYFLDADDRALPHATAVLSTALVDHPDALLAYGAITVFRDSSAPANVGVAPFPRDPVLLASAALIRRSAFAAVGPFSPGNESMVDWFTRAVDSGRPLLPVAEVVAQRRIHSANTSLNQIDVRSSFMRILKSSLDRKRAMGDERP